MFPGLVTKLSEKVVATAATLVADADVLIITGSGTTLQTLVPKTGGFSQIVVLIPTGGTLTIGTSGNILVGDVLAQNRATYLIYSKSQDAWFAQDPL